MIYRVNPALPPAGASREALAAHFVCEAAVRASLAHHGEEEFRRLLSLHIIDTSESSDLLAEVWRRASCAAALLGGVAGPPAVGPIGSGPAAALYIWAKGVHALADEDAADLPLAGPRRRLWDLAHPEAARAFGALHTLCVDANPAIAALQSWAVALAPPAMALLAVAVDAGEIRPTPETAEEMP